MAHELTEELFIDAEPERVFDAWTEARHMTAWWAHDGEFRTETFESDLRAGGRWLVRFRAVDGSLSGAEGEYLRVERPSHLSFTWKADWDVGGPTQIELEFQKRGKGTVVKLRHSGFDEAGWKNANKNVWQETLAALGTYLKTKA